MSRERRLPVAALALLPALLAGAVLVSLATGPAALSLREVAGVLLGTGEGTARSVVLGLRLPRTVLAILAGTALSASGVIFQGLLRNPLADPYLLGVSSGAALGAVGSMVLGAARVHPAVVPLAALLGGGAAAAAVYGLARREGGLPIHTVILAGVIVSSFCSALVLLLNILMEARQLQGALFWTMGSLAAPPGEYLAPVAVAVAAGLAMALLGGGRLNLLTQGEETAAVLGLDVEREKRRLFLAACLMTGAAVSATGLIGFVGLVVPHAARILFGPDHRVLLPAAALLGSAFLVLADSAARVVLAPAELPVGVVTALVGAPFFLWLLVRRRRGWLGG